MAERPARRRGRPARLFSAYADHIAAALAFVATFELANHWPRTLDQGIIVLGSEVAVGLAVLAVVLASMAIIAAFMGEDYLALVRATSRGFRGVMAPYLQVAVVAGATIVAALFAMIGWPAFGASGEPFALAAATALTVDATVGTVQLVFVTARQGGLFARLVGRMSEWQSALRERRRQVEIQRERDDPPREP